MISITFEGGDELAEALSRLSMRNATKELRSALVEGAEPIRKGASSLARRRAPKPDIADNILISTARTEGDQAAVAVGPAKRFYYGRFLELGTVRMSAKPFLRPAFDANRDKSLGLIAPALWRELAARGISRRTQTTNNGVEELGQTTGQALTPAAFKGKQRQRKAR